MKHKAALKTIFAAAVFDFIGALVFAAAEHTSVANALYWGITTATTVGYGDVTPHTTLGHIVAVLVMLTVIPLFAATFSLFTTILTAEHIKKHNAALHQKLDHIIRHHPDIPEFPDEVK